MSAKNRTVYQCEQCDRNFDRPSSLAAHIATHDPNRTKKFICECGAAFYQKSSLTTHRNVKHGNRRYSCQKCSKTFTTTYALKNHQEQHNPDRTPNFVCECGSTFFLKKSLDVHKIEQHGNVSFSCNQCPKTFKRERYLTTHLETHKDNRPREVKCDVCDVTFFNKLGLTQHKDQVHREKRYACDSCDFVSGTAGQLSTHKKIHSTEKTIACTFEGCKKMFKTNSVMQGHLKTHLGQSYPCTWPGCTVSVSRKEALKIHLAIHANEKSFECDWPGCTMKFNTPVHKRAHYKIHSKPIACTWINCKSKFANKTGLEVHLNKHRNVRPYICPWKDCKSAFYSESNLREHKRVHSDTKPFPCTWEQCGKNFGRREHLESHFRTHTGERPYVCKVEKCNQSFAFDSSFRDHQKIHHLGKCQNCLQAGQTPKTANSVHFRFAEEKLCLICAQFKYTPEVAFRAEYHLATFVKNRFGNHPNVRSILFDQVDPDPDRCSRRRPDIRILTHTSGDGIIECDEHGHKPYMCSMKEIQTAWSELQATKNSFVRRRIQEDSRLSEIVTTGTIEKTMVWRLNVDRYCNDEGTILLDNQIFEGEGIVTVDIATAHESRFKMICDEIQVWLDGKLDSVERPFISVVYYYYDGLLRQESLVPTDGDEYKQWMVELSNHVY